MIKRLAVALLVSCLILWAAITGTTNYVIEQGPMLASGSGSCGVTGPGCLIQWADKDSGIFMAANVTQRTVYDGAGVTQVKTVSYTATAADDGTMITFNSGTGRTLTLPTIIGGFPPFLSWWIHATNIGTGALTIDPAGLNIDGVAGSITLTGGQGVTIYNDGLNWFTDRGIGSPAQHTLGMAFGISGGAALPSTGTTTVVATFACAIGGTWYATNDSGTITFDVLKNGSSITAAAQPTSSATTNSGATTGWTTSIAPGDAIGWKILSISGSPTTASVTVNCQ